MIADGKPKQIDADWMGVTRFEDPDREPKFVLGPYRADGTWLTQIQRDTVEECLGEATGLSGVAADRWEIVDLVIPPEWRTDDVPPDFAPSGG